MEDPTLQRAISSTGFTYQEELTAFTSDMLGNLINTQMRAHFEEPSGGWPDPVHIVRPKQEETPGPKPKSKKPDEVSSVWGLIDFTNAIHRENHGE